MKSKIGSVSVDIEATSLEDVTLQAVRGVLVCRQSYNRILLLCGAMLYK